MAVLSTPTQTCRAERQAENTKASVEKLTALLEYVAVMADVELPEEDDTETAEIEETEGEEETEEEAEEDVEEESEELG